MPRFAGETVTVEFEGIPFQIDATRPDDPAWAALGVRKSGSSMFNRAMKLLAKFNKVNWVDIPGDLFANNIAVRQWRGRPATPGLLRPGNAYGGFRDFPHGLAKSAVFRQAIKVLLVRDPRDAIVSEFYSTRQTHSIPEGANSGARADMLRRREAARQVTIDEFARAEAAKMADTMERFIPLLDDPMLLLLRYEDIIFEKGRMIREVAHHFGWAVQPEQVDAILKWIDVIPAAENPDAFIRKVIPGDHRQKLSGAAIAEIGEPLARAMNAFGYA